METRMGPFAQARRHAGADPRQAGEIAGAVSDGKGPTAERIAASSSSWNGEPLLAYPAGRPLVSLLRILIPPRARLEEHFHPVVNAGVVLRGELTVVAGNGTERTFRPGEGIVEMVGTLHYGENRGDDEVELVMF